MIVKKLYESNAQSINKEDKLTKKEYKTIFEVFSKHTYTQQFKNGIDWVKRYTRQGFEIYIIKDKTSNRILFADSNYIIRPEEYNYDQYIINDTDNILYIKVENEPFHRFIIFERGYIKPFLPDKEGVMTSYFQTYYCIEGKKVSDIFDDAAHHLFKVLSDEEVLDIIDKLKSGKYLTFYCKQNNYYRRVDIDRNGNPPFDIFPLYTCEKNGNAYYRISYYGKYVFDVINDEWITCFKDIKEVERNGVGISKQSTVVLKTDTFYMHGDVYIVDFDIFDVESGEGSFKYQNPRGVFCYDGVISINCKDMSYTFINTENFKIIDDNLKVEGVITHNRIIHGMRNNTKQQMWIVVKDDKYNIVGSVKGGFLLDEWVDYLLWGGTGSFTRIKVPSSKYRDMYIKLVSDNNKIKVGDLLHKCGIVFCIIDDKIKLYDVVYEKYLVSSDGRDVFNFVGCLDGDFLGHRGEVCVYGENDDKYSLFFANSIGLSDDIICKGVEEVHSFTFGDYKCLVFKKNNNMYFIGGNGSLIKTLGATDIDGKYIISKHDNGYQILTDNIHDELVRVFDGLDKVDAIYTEYPIVRKGNKYTYIRNGRKLFVKPNGSTRWFDKCEWYDDENDSLTVVEDGVQKTFKNVSSLSC